MVKLTLSDQYQIKNELEISYSQLQVLTKLYLPIIGKNAYVLYLTLHSESDLNQIFTSFFNITRLSILTDLTIDQLKEAFTTLEGIGLLKTYVKYQEVNSFIFEIHSPVSAKTFFQNQIYNVLLYRTLKKDEYDKTKYTFLTKETNTKEYEDITSNFDDAFYFNYSSNEGKEAFALNDIRENEGIEVQSNYDLSLFYKGLSSMQIRRDLFTHEDLVLISQLGSVYNIDGTTLSNLVIESMEDNHLNQEKLKEKVRVFHEMDHDLNLNAVYRTQPYELRNKENSDNDESKKIRYLETTSPYKMIEAKMQSTPLNIDLQCIEKCMTEYGVPAGVMNVIIEVCWQVKYDRIVPGYVLKLAQDWKYKNITTVKQAIEIGTKIINENKINKNSYNKNHVSINKANKKDDIEKDDIELEISEIDIQKLKEKIRKGGL